MRERYARSGWRGSDERSVRGSGERPSPLQCCQQAEEIFRVTGTEAVFEAEPDADWAAELDQGVEATQVALSGGVADRFIAGRETDAGDVDDEDRRSKLGRQLSSGPLAGEGRVPPHRRGAG